MPARVRAGRTTRRGMVRAMTRIALVFPGQGSQSVGMGEALAATFPEAAVVFAEADAALGEPIAALAFGGPAEDLDRTQNAQPALLATSIASLRALEAALAAAGRRALEPAFFAGHSMGQYSALVAAGVISLADGVRLVRERGPRLPGPRRGGAPAPGH